MFLTEKKISLVNFLILLLVSSGVFSCFHDYDEIVETIKEKQEDESVCFRDLKILLESGHFDKLISAWSDFGEEHLYGNSYDFGNFDECRSFKYGDIRAQHCLIQYHYKPMTGHKVIAVAPNKSFYNFGWSNINQRFGGAICLPESCTVEDIEEIMDEVLKESDYMQASYYDQQSYCRKSTSVYSFNANSIFGIIFFALVAIFAALGTYLTNLESESIFIKFFQCFSLEKNFNSLKDLSTDTFTIPCINGLKVISTLGIIRYHYHLMRMAYPFKDSSESREILNMSLYHTTAMSFVVFIEGFFIMSGLLLGQSLKKCENVDFWKMLLQRYLRLTPSVFAIIMVLGISVTLANSNDLPYMFPHTGLSNWYNYGYTTLLHLAVYTNPRNICIPHSWFVNVNVQLGALAPLVEIGIRKQQKVNRLLCYAAIILIGLALRFFTFLRHESYFEKDMTYSFNSNSEVIATTYFASHLWLLPFFSGIFLANILDSDAKFSLRNEKLKNITVTMSFYTSIAFIIAFVFLYPSTKVLTTIYLTVWILAMCVIIYSCHNGYGGVVNEFLSSKYWTPIAKVSLGIYLVSPGVQAYKVMLLKRPMELNRDFNFFQDTAYDLLSTGMAVVLLYLFIEAPFTQVGKLITRTKK